MKNTEIIFKDLVCVVCGNDVSPDLSKGIEIACAKCMQTYPTVNNVPIILHEGKSIFSFSDFLNQKNLFFDISKKGKIISWISKYAPDVGGNNLGKRNFRFLESILTNNRSDRKPRVLVVGGSIIGHGMNEFVHSPNLDFVEADVSFGPRTDIIFDAHSIPYKSECFDCVVAQAVLEHVIDPIKCVEEIYRVLKPDGIVYAETPFMQQVHGGPYDFTRYTRSGHRKLFHRFAEIKSGASAGSATALAWSYQYFLLAMFGYGSKLRLAVKFFARLTGFWIKYFDYITMHNSRDTDGASGFFFIGSKASSSLSGKEIIDYYYSTKSRQS